MRKSIWGILALGLCGSGATAAAAADQPRTMEQVVDRVVTNENRLNQQIRQYTPLVETYIQNLKPDKELGYVPAGDKYFLGRADFHRGVELVSLSETQGKGKKILGSVGNFFSFAMQFLPDGFLQMIFEDQDFNIVRFNGAYGGGGHASWYFHFDSWRTNVQAGLWMPSFVYSEERELRYAVAKKLDFRAQTRLWGYNLGHAAQEQELSKILVETPVQDDTKTANDLTPVQAQRSWDRQAEENVADRFERIGLMAPKGEIDKVLETVVNNLEVTNNLDVDPEVHCRVLMTTTLESFTLGHTIVLSRGLIDVMPDEASLATVIAHELGHVVLGHRMDSNYAFFDQLLVEDKDTFRHFYFARTPAEEQAANAKAIQFLNNSPYKTQLGNAGLFLTALQSRQKEIPNLISAHLGERVPATADLKTVAPADAKQNPLMLAALPIGGRVKLDPWLDKLELIKSKPIGTIAEREKMPFEVTPFMPYLTRFGSEAVKPIAASAAAPADQKQDTEPSKPQ